MTPLERYDKIMAMLEGGMTQAQIARHLGVSRQAVSMRILKGPPKERRRQFPRRFKIKVGTRTKTLLTRY